MTTTQQIITVLMLVLGTALTRFLPFIIFRGKHTPHFIQYLSTVLPSAVFAMLVVYCLKDVEWTGGNHGLPELIGIAVTVVLHLWRKQMLLSILGGTLVYMLLVQNLF